MKLEDLHILLEDLYKNDNKEIAFEILKKNIKEEISLGEFELLNNNVNKEFELDEEDFSEFENLMNSEEEFDLLLNEELNISEKLKRLTEIGLSQEELDKEISKLMGEELNEEDIDKLTEEELLELEEIEDKEENK